MSSDREIQQAILGLQLLLMAFILGGLVGSAITFVLTR